MGPRKTIGLRARIERDHWKIILLLVPETAVQSNSISNLTFFVRGLLSFHYIKRSINFELFCKNLQIVLITKANNKNKLIIKTFKKHLLYLVHQWNTQSWNYESWGSFFYFQIDEYWHSILQNPDSYVLGRLSIWTSWILNICFHFFHCTCL